VLFYVGVCEEAFDRNSTVCCIVLLHYLLLTGIRKRLGVLVLLTSQHSKKLSY